VSESSTGALDTLKQRAGVCRDFAHVGVALCRSLMMPARLVVGYLHELEPMDMHAWYEVYLGDRWFPFDATQADARGGRVVVAHGRDAADVAFLSNYGPLEITRMEVSVTRV
jgi:transglutaminase-like putative cysteine protease